MNALETRALASRMVAPLVFTSRLEDFALVTHAVPAARVRAHLPGGFELETFRHEWFGKTEELAFVSVASFFNRGFRWKPAPLPRINFEQITYRTYVRYKGRQGLYYFATYLGSLSAFALQGSFTQNTYPAEIRLFRGPSENDALRIRAEIHSRRGDTRFKLRFDGKGRPDPEQARFLTDRYHGFFRSSLGNHLDSIVRHRPMTPYAGELMFGTFGIWEKMGILFSSESLSAAWSVLLEPSIDFDFLPPIPAALIPNEPLFQTQQEHRLHIL